MGERCTAFGKDGEVDLLTGIGKAPIGYYKVTSAPTVVRGRIVLGGWVTDNQYWGEPSGVIRAFDAVRSEEHTSELQSLMRISYAVFCLKNKTNYKTTTKKKTVHR